MPIERTCFVGLSFAALTIDEACQQVMSLRSNRHFSYVVTPNVDHVVRLDRLTGTARGDELAAAYVAADLCLCDSRVLARLAALFDRRLSVVPGSDLTGRILGEVEKSTPIAILGSNQTAIDDLKQKYGLMDVRHHSPPMGMLDKPQAMTAAADFIEAASGCLIFLAIGSPQSEILARRVALAGRSRGVALCIGASIDFLTGRQARAPHWVQRLGFEWAHRLLSEPRRMWRRYLVDGPRIFAIAWRDRQRFR